MPTASRWGAFIDGIDRFDAPFFRIAPVEARLLDPQQRLLLETSWEALEEAGIDPAGLKGSRAGVFAGIGASDYRDLLSASAGNDLSTFYVATGTASSTAIGRVAFTLGLEGPAIAVDTACSSSLVAVHQAVVSLQRGESDLALAGGVHAILSPLATEIFVKAGMLSPDGRCKTFDAAADGFVRGEGCGMVVLKAPVGRRGGWGPDLGGGARLGGKSGRSERGTDGAERSGSGAGDRRGAEARGVGALGGGLPGGARDGGRSLVTRWRRTRRRRRTGRVGPRIVRCWWGR